MRFLGINDGHNATACYLRNGEIVALASEERFTNVKNQGGYPAEAIGWILEENNLRMEDFDRVAFAHLGIPRVDSKVYGQYPLRRRVFVWACRFLPRALMGSPLLIRPYLAVTEPYRRAQLTRFGKKHGFGLGNVGRIEHHLAHAYAALYGSGFTSAKEPVLAFTCDNSGDGVSSTVGRWDGERSYQRLQLRSSFHSMGDLYARVTEYLGMKPEEHEYKLMGMAPYVPDTYSERALSKFLSCIEFDETRGCIVNRRNYGPNLLLHFKNALFGERFDNVCAGVQRHFESVILRWVRWWARHTGIRRAVFGGGSFMNVKANMLIAEMPEFDEVFFCPSASDESLAIGAAYRLAEECGEAVRKPLGSLHRGPAYSSAKIAQALTPYADQLTWTRPPDIEGAVAELVAEGRIVARFKGPAEWGARALGGRSILCRGDDLKIIHRLNRSIKLRDFWMPFASSVLDEDAERYLIAPWRVNGAYMIVTYRTTEAAQRDLAAGLHPFDNTCRAQIVRATEQPDYHRLLSHFKELTGLGGLVNTSFNLHGYPIVGRPESAFETLLHSQLDYLAIEDFLVQPKPGAQQPDHA